MSGLAKRVRYAREQLSISQSELARRVGIRPQAIQFIEAGRVRRPRNLVEIAAALHVNPEWLLFGKGNMTTGVKYESKDEALGLSDEAIELARTWMELPKPQRTAVRETVYSLAKKRK